MESKILASANQSDFIHNQSEKCSSMEIRFVLLTYAVASAENSYVVFVGLFLETENFASINTYRSIDNRTLMSCAAAYITFLL